MNNNQVAHLWANQSRPSAKGSSFYFEGDTIYSYGSHFPIARLYKGVVLFTSHRYSVTTAKHIGITRRACSHLPVFHVDNPRQDPSGKDVVNYKASIEARKLSLARARTPRIETVISLMEEANSFCETFGFKTRFAVPSGTEWDKLKETAKAQSLKARKTNKAKREAAIRAENQQLADWLAGKAVSIPYTVQRVLLRQRKGTDEQDGVDMLETSKGASVPLTEAERAFRFAVAMRHRGWHRNGDTFKVGDFHLDAVNEQGIVAGCHRIAWDEIERFAKEQGWTV